MQKQGRFILTLALLGTICLSPMISQAEPDTQILANKMTLAKQYSDLVPVKKEVEETIDKLVIHVPMDQRPLFRSVLERTIDVDRLESISEMSLVETFSEDELKVLVDFYSTDLGQSIREKMPSYQSQLKPVLEQMVREAVESMKRQTQ